jgi:hypothetical protein
MTKLAGNSDICVLFSYEFSEMAISHFFAPIFWNKKLPIWSQKSATYSGNPI